MYTRKFTPLTVTTRVLSYPVSIVQASNRLALNLCESQQTYTARSSYSVIERQLHHRDIGYDNRCVDHNTHTTYYMVVFSTSLVIRTSFGAKGPNSVQARIRLEL